MRRDRIAAKKQPREVKMPLVSSIVKLPEEIKAELGKRLKASGYGDIDGHTMWLREQGFKVSRSALGRYSVDVKARSRVAAQIASDLSVLEDLDSMEGEAATYLLVELGALRVREVKIMKSLADLGIG